jgi:hypothetical protein
MSDASRSPDDAPSPPRAASPTQGPIEVERATDEDAGEIARLLRRNADVPTLIVQPPSVVLRHIDEFVVVRGPERIVVGCAQLHWHRPRMAEVMAVAVEPSREPCPATPPSCGWPPRARGSSRGSGFGRSRCGRSR